MKNFFYLFSLLCVLMMSSCGKDATEETRETLQQAYSQLSETTKLIKAARTQDRVITELPFGVSFDMNDAMFLRFVQDSIYVDSLFTGDAVSTCKVQTTKYGAAGQVEILRDNVFSDTGLQVFTMSYNRADLDSVECDTLFSKVINEFGSGFKSASPFSIHNTVTRKIQYWAKNNLVVCVSLCKNTKDFTIQLIDASTYTDGDVDNLEAVNKQAMRNYYLNQEYYQQAIEECLESKGQIPDGFIKVDANYDENDGDDMTVRSDVTYEDKNGSTGYIRHVFVFDIDGNLVKEIE